MDTFGGHYSVYEHWGKKHSQEPICLGFKSLLCHLLPV